MQRYLRINIGFLQFSWRKGFEDSRDQGLRRLFKRMLANDCISAFSILSKSSTIVEIILDMRILFESAQSAFDSSGPVGTLFRNREKANLATKGIRARRLRAIKE